MTSHNVELIDSESLVHVSRATGLAAWKNHIRFSRERQSSGTSIGYEVECCRDAAGTLCDGQTQRSVIALSDTENTANTAKTKITRRRRPSSTAMIRQQN